MLAGRSVAGNTTRAHLYPGSPWPGVGAGPGRARSIAAFHRPWTAEAVMIPSRDELFHCGDPPCAEAEGPILRPKISALEYAMAGAAGTTSGD